MLVALAVLVAVGGLSGRYLYEWQARTTDMLEAFRPLEAPAARPYFTRDAARGTLAAVGESSVELPTRLLPDLLVPQPEPDAASASANIAVEDNPVAAETATSDAIESVARVSAPAVAVPPASPNFRFSDTSIVVSENNVAARIEVLRSGDLLVPAEVAWWTEDLGAVAGDDYADMGLRTERFAVSAEALTLFIPLINDSAPEGVEAFAVHLGSAPVAGGQRATVSAVRVEIVDDD
jgi:hypothetical protein